MPQKSKSREEIDLTALEPKPVVSIDAVIESDEAIYAKAEAAAEIAYNDVLERENAARKKLAALPLERSDRSKQMLLFAPLFDNERNRTFVVADTLNRYVLTKRRDVRHSKNDTLKRVYSAQSGPAEITPAVLDGKIIFPGAFEQLIELVLRKMTIEQNAELGLWQEKRKPGIHHVSVMFSLAELRRRLAANDSERKLSEIREALEVMSRCSWTVRTSQAHRFVGELRGPILRIEAARKELRADAKGEKEMYFAYWHPVIAEAILAGDHFLLDNRILKLKDPLARWILNRLNARYRQAAKDDAISGNGYTLSLATIFAESGIEAEVRLRATLERVRSALNALREHFFLSPLRPYEEIPTYENTPGRPKIIDMTWVLFPSSEFAQTVIDGNREARQREAQREAQPTLTRGK